MSTDYFAALVDQEEFGRRFAAKVTEYRKAKAVVAIHDRIGRAYNYHFGMSAEGMHLTSAVTRAGEQGELAEIRINHLRANALTVQTLTTGPQIGWLPIPTNRDSSSVKQTYVAVTLLDYYWLDQGVSKSAQNAVGESIPLTEGFVFSPWDDSLGEAVAVNPDGSEVMSGDFRFYNPLPWDVVRDPSKKSWEEGRWVAVCLWKNKYELAAEYPEQADAILDAPVGEEGGNRDDSFGDCDDVPCWYFFHKRSPIPELKNGREAIILGDGTVLKDGELTYDAIPLHRVVPDEQYGTPFGYSQYHEGIGIQEAIDSLSSAILTNQDAFARQMVAVERGEPFSPEDIGGAKVLYYTNKPPAALQLTSSPAEAFRFTDSLKNDLQRVQGVNDAVQGQLPGDAKLSGSALALLSSQAIQQNSTLQANYLRMVRSIGNCILNEWRKRTPLPRQIRVVGKSSQFLLHEQSIQGADISDIKDVQVDIGNPVSQTHAGKLELAQMVMQIPNAVTSPEQIDQLLTTGKMEHLTQSVRDELILILDENEKIAEGESPPAVIHDDHLRHGREHRTTLASVSARSDPAIVEASTDHLHQHYKLFFGWPDPMLPPPMPALDPMTGAPDPEFDPTSPIHDPMYRERMLILVGQTPPPPMLPMGAPGMGAPPPGEPAPGISAEKPAEPAGQQTDLPSMPTNPLSGEKAVAPAGATVPQ